jgi:hypothetical protein
MNSRRQSPFVHGIVLVAVAVAAASLTQSTHAFSSSNTLKKNLQTLPPNLLSPRQQYVHSFVGRSRGRISVSNSAQEEEVIEVEELASTTVIQQQQQGEGEGITSPLQQSALWQKISDKMGTVDEDRLIFPEYTSGEVPRMFSSLQYSQNEQTGAFTATHAAGSVLGAAALVAGTTVGAGVLALPAATVAAGFLPSAGAMIVAYVYMTMSGLLISELTLNRMVETGRPAAGLLDLYKSSLGGPTSAVGTAAYFFLHYAVSCLKLQVE